MFMIRNLHVGVHKQEDVSCSQCLIVSIPHIKPFLVNIIVITSFDYFYGLIVDVGLGRHLVVSKTRKYTQGIIKFDKIKLHLTAFKLI